MDLRLEPETAAFLDAEHRLLIGGEWANAADRAVIDAINPANEQPISRCAAAGEVDIDRAVAAARAAFEAGPWPGMSPSDRGALLWRLADSIEANGDVLTQLEIFDNGMPFDPAAKLVVPGAVKTLRYYAGWPTKISGRTTEPDVRPGQERAPVTFTRREPVGVVGQIIPWNYPLGMAVMKLGPALATGCTVVLKPDEHTPLTALYLGELIREVGFPPGVVNIVPGTGPAAGAPLVAHTDVDKVAFTGSTATGRSIVRSAAGNLKRVSLELGGKSPFIVFPDADVDNVVAAAARLGFFLQGQNCQCPSRMYIHDAVFDEVVDRLVAAAKALPIGPGWDPDTRIGPLISAEQLARVQTYIDSGLSDGAILLTGDRESLRPGYFISPTVFGNVHRDMRIMRDEIFGPVVCVERFSDTRADRVAEFANDTDYGLVASVWTRDLGIANELAKRIKAGVVGVNHHGGGDVNAPFGGYKQSGWHREFGVESLDAYLETKTVIMRY